jgi:hypothetical protein
MNATATESPALTAARREYLRLDSMAASWRRDAESFGTPNICAKAHELTLRARAAYAAYRGLVVTS